MPLPLLRAILPKASDVGRHAPLHASSTSSMAHMDCGNHLHDAVDRKYLTLEDFASLVTYLEGMKE